jgi:hypothetical protein
MQLELKKIKMAKNIFGALLGLLFLCNTGMLVAQGTEKQILIDIAHGQRFWNDPADMAGKDPAFIDRIRYMTTEFRKTAESVNRKVGYVKGKIKPDALDKCDLLFVHLPSSKYDTDEVEAIKRYVQRGGSLFLVMDENYWSTLSQTNVNDIVGPFGIKFGENNTDSLSGGYTKPGALTNEKLKVTYHGARTVEGGTPFCFSNQSAKPFGTFIDVRNGGGKVVAMGDGMVSLYMTSWKDVTDYQCSEFMHEVFAWLLK